MKKQFLLSLLVAGLGYVAYSAGRGYNNWSGNNYTTESPAETAFYANMQSLESGTLDVTTINQAYINYSGNGLGICSDPVCPPSGTLLDYAIAFQQQWKLAASSLPANYSAYKANYEQLAQYYSMLISNLKGAGAKTAAQGTTNKPLSITTKNHLQ